MPLTWRRPVTSGDQDGGGERRIHFAGAAGRILSAWMPPTRSQRFTEGFYKKLCSGKLTAALETLEYLKHETNVWFEITTLLIPGENDLAVEIKR